MKKAKWSRLLGVGLALLIAISVAITAIPVGVYASPPQINAKAWIVVDADTGEILTEANSEEVLAPASMTKLMTLYLTLEKINNHKISWLDEAKISEFANKISKNPSLSSYQLTLGANYTVLDLFFGAVVNSSNASAVSLAEYIAVDETGFIEMMNKKAQNFGLSDTRFVNSSGLNNSDLMGNHPRGTEKNDDNKLSARSMALIAYRLINDYPEIVDYTSLTQVTIKEGKPGEQLIRSTNKLLPGRELAFDGARGLKTGYIFNAGYCFAGYTVRPSGRLISIVMGASSSDERFKGSATLLEYGYSILKDRANSANAAVDANDEQAIAGAVAKRFLYPDKLNFYNPIDAASEISRAQTDGSLIFSYGNTGIGIMKNGKADVVMYNGLLYSVSRSGRMLELDDGKLVGKAAFTYINQDKKASLGNVGSLTELEKFLKNQMDDVNKSYCFKIEGEFTPRSISTLSAGVLGSARVERTKGVILGFWRPDNRDDLLKQGFTLYYISGDRKAGGLLKNVEIHNASVVIDELDLSEPLTGGTIISINKKPLTDQRNNVEEGDSSIEDDAMRAEYGVADADAA